MRPDGTIMVRHRVKAGFAFGDSPNPPAREGIRGKQGLRSALRVLVTRDSCKQAMPGVGCTEFARSLLAIQCECIRGQVLEPEGFLEALLQGFRFILEAHRLLLVAESCRQGRCRLFGG